ncbi:hypothetical protein C8N43_0374 [Litoreibacter ponti]|uniref:Uncharacterized protein n=1 Tax=Litoreibacter ponti TaxID=1510457 RepID=A0A2T6BI49_9RHOB|nr:hypothetical protein [Litoreibacter ponti]PTX55732.1 hypothetical protein C8N43_0374 [Litoreibacter ponti]
MITGVLRRITGLFRKPLLIGSPEANKLVLAQIAQQGDDGLSERHVRHLAYPMRDAGAKDRSHVVDLFSEIGLDPSEAAMRGGVMGEHHAAVATPEFDHLTGLLRETLEEMGWEYDGWECAIRREG